MRTCAQMIFGGYRLPGIYVLSRPGGRTVAYSLRVDVGFATARRSGVGAYTHKKSAALPRIMESHRN